MSQFIDDYQHDIISSEFQNLTISQKQLNINTQYVFLQKEYSIKVNHLKQYLLNANINHQNLLHQLQITTSFQHQKLFTQHQINPSFDISFFAINQYFQPYFDVVSKIILKKQTNSLIISSTFIKNAQPFLIKSKNHKNLICRTFNRLNSYMKYGKYVIDPINGSIFLNITSVMNSNQFNRLIVEPQKALEWIKSDILVTKQCLMKTLGKILVLINQLPQKFMSAIGQNKKQFKQSHLDTQKLSKVIERAMQICSFYYPFFDISNNLTVSQDQQYKQLKADSNLRRCQQTFAITKVKPLQLKMQQFFQFFKLIKNQEKIVKNNFEFYEYFKHKQNQFFKQLSYPQVSVNNKFDKVDIFSQIYIDNINSIKWQDFAEGGFGKLSRAKVSFWYFESQYKKSVGDNSKYQNVKKPQSLKLTKYLVKKFAKNQNFKIDHQKQILKLIEKKHSINIPKFYQTFQTSYANCLFLDYYPSKNLEYYKRSNQQTFSLLTKIQFLIQICQGLRFLRDSKIVHLDIKPPNILIGSCLSVKITDYGQSYNKEVCQKNFRPGYTLPYAAPQVFQNEINYNQKLDVFSFGMLMYELLFETFPLELKNIFSHKLIYMYRNKSYVNQLKICPQKIDSFGPGYLMRILCNLCLKCLNKDMNKRPLLDWIYLILKYSRQYLNVLY